MEVTQRKESSLTFSKWKGRTVFRCVTIIENDMKAQLFSFSQRWHIFNHIQVLLVFHHMNPFDIAMFSSKTKSNNNKKKKPTHDKGDQVWYKIAYSITCKWKNKIKKNLNFLVVECLFKFARCLLWAPCNCKQNCGIYY